VTTRRALGTGPAPSPAPPARDRRGHHLLGDAEHQEVVQPPELRPGRDGRRPLGPGGAADAPICPTPAEPPPNG
jgi:hypothetical protein